MHKFEQVGVNYQYAAATKEMACFDARKEAK